MDCNEILIERPFKIMAKAEIVNVNNHPKLTNKIREKLKNRERFLVKVRLNGERIWCIVIGMKDSNNANFDNSEEGQIFVGILDNEPVNNEKLHFNDLIEFQSCDVFEIQDLP